MFDVTNVCVTPHGVQIVVRHWGQIAPAMRRRYMEDSPTWPTFLELVEKNLTDLPQALGLTLVSVDMSYSESQLSFKRV